MVMNMIKSWCPHRRYYELENKHPKFQIENGVKVLQTRDFLNWFASYVYGKDRHKYQYNTKPIQMWYRITKIIYNGTKGMIPIIFDDFVINKNYRMEICAQLDGKYNEDTLLQVNNNGDGSSFDGQKYDGRANEMNVLTRYKQIDPDLYLKFFTAYPYYLRLYRRICTDEEKIEFLESIGAWQIVST